MKVEKTYKSLLVAFNSEKKQSNKAEAILMGMSSKKFMDFLIYSYGNEQN